MAACSRPRPARGVSKVVHVHYDPNAGMTSEQKVERAKKANAASQETWRRKSQERLLSAPFEKLTKTEQRTRILSEQDGNCALCKTPPSWNGMPLKFDLDHVDGNRADNSRTNLRLLCPNCHSQTPTYKSGNSTGKRRSDKDVIDAIMSTDSLYKALEKLNMNRHGGNYTRLRGLIKKHDLKVSPHYAI